MKLINRRKSEKGQIADIMMFFFFIVFVIYFIILFTSMQFFFRAQKMVDNVVRDEVEIIRTKGIFTQSEYESFLAKLSKYGNYNVNVFAEKQDNAGQRGKLFSIETIKDQPFKVGDFIQILVESSKPPLFSVILNTNFLFSSNHKNGSDFRMQSLASGMICSDGFIKGVEVINLITKNASSIPVRLKTLKYSTTSNTEDMVDKWYLYGPSSYTGDAAKDSNTTPITDYNPTAHTENTDGWINYEGRYTMDVTLNDSYAITEMYFTEMLPY